MTRPNIILIVIDTLRRDGLEVYSNKTKTPNIVQLSKDALIYPNCISPYSWTIPSHLAMFTGKYLEQLGLHETDLSDPRKTVAAFRALTTPFLSERLADLGYDTIGISANELVSPSTGLDRGFKYFLRQHYVEYWDPLLEDVLAHIRDAYGTSAAEIARRLIREGRISELWSLYRNVYRIRKRLIRTAGFPKKKGAGRIIEMLAAGSFEQPFFLFLNFMELHEPYNSTVNVADDKYQSLSDLFQFKRLREGMLSRIRKDYYSEAILVDKYLGYLISYLKRSGLYDNSLIIVTSDHGQGLREHGFLGHGTFLHDEIIDVPLIIKYPGNERPVVEDGFQNILDIYGFILNAAESAELVPFPSRAVTFSMSCGLNPFWGKSFSQMSSYYRSRVRDFDRLEKRYFAKRVAVLDSGYKMVFRPEDAVIEEFTELGKPIGTASHAVELERLRRLADEFCGRLAAEPDFTKTVSKSRTSPIDDDEIIEERLKRLGYM